MIQNISNDNRNPSYNVITTKYTCINITSKWIHRDIEYNTAGNPILRLYLGEEKQINKEFYINGVKTTNISENESEETVINEECFSFDKTTNIISTVDKRIGRYVISKDSFLSYIICTPNDIINDKDLIVIVEAEPILKEIKYNCSNPLYITKDYKVTFTGLYSDGNEYSLEKVFDNVNNIELLSSNKHWFDIIENQKIKVNNSNGIAFLDIINRNDFSSTILPTEPIKVIITDENNSKNLNENTVISHEYKTSYNLVNGKNNDAYLVFNEIYSYNDEVISTTSLLEYIHVEDNELINITNEYELIPKQLGSTTFICNIDETKINVAYYDISNSIQVYINITKQIKHIELILKKNNIALEPTITNNINTYNISLTSDLYNLELKEIYLDNSYEIKHPLQYDVQYNDSLICMYEDYSFKCLSNGSSEIIASINYGHDMFIASIIIHAVAITDKDDSQIDIYTYVDNELITDTIYIDMGSIVNLSFYTNFDNSKIKYKCHLKDNRVNLKRISVVDTDVISTGAEDIYVLKDNKLVLKSNLVVPSLEEDIPLSIDISLYSTIDNELVSIKNKSFNIIITNIKEIETLIPYYNNEPVLNNQIINLGLFESNNEAYKFQINVQPDDLIVRTTEIVNENEVSEFINYRQDPNDVTVIYVVPKKIGTFQLILKPQYENIQAVFNINIINNCINGITIKDGNDLDYMWYDNNIRTDEKFTNDFPRYYLAINNSLHIPYIIEKNYDSAVYDLKFLSSNPNLLKCDVNNNGDLIVTALSDIYDDNDVYKYELELYGDDNINSSSRYPNMVWVTILDTITNISASCQVRVIKNQITSIDIPYLDEEIHDVIDENDNDIYDEPENEKEEIDNNENENIYNVDYYYPTEEDIDNNVEYRLDCHVGDVVSLDVNLTGQDDNFGVSNQIKYQYSVKLPSVELNDEDISSDDVYENYEWNDVNEHSLMAKYVNLPLDKLSESTNDLNYYDLNEIDIKDVGLSEDEEKIYNDYMSNDYHITLNEIEQELYNEYLNNMSDLINDQMGFKKIEDWNNSEYSSKMQYEYTKINNEERYVLHITDVVDICKVIIAETNDTAKHINFIIINKDPKDYDVTSKIEHITYYETGISETKKFGSTTITKLTSSKTIKYNKYLYEGLIYLFDILDLKILLYDTVFETVLSTSEKTYWKALKKSNFDMITIDSNNEKSYFKSWISKYYYLCTTFNKMYYLQTIFNKINETAKTDNDITPLTIVAIDKNSSKCNHLNANDDYDWYDKSISDINDINNKNNVQLNMVCCNPGTIVLRAKPALSAKYLNDDKFYASNNNVLTGITSSSGYVNLITNTDELLEIHANDKYPDEDDIGTNKYRYKSEYKGYAVKVRYKTSKYSSKSLPNVKVTMDAGNRFIIDVPEKRGSSKIYIDNDTYDITKRRIEVTISTIEKDETTKKQIPIENVTVIINSKFKKKIPDTSKYEYVDYTIASKTNSKGIVTSPSENPLDIENANIDTTIKLLAKPGEGRFYRVRPSRYIKINVTNKVEFSEMILCVLNFAKNDEHANVNNTFINFPENNVENYINDNFIWDKDTILEIKDNADFDNNSLKLYIHLLDNNTLDIKYSALSWSTSDSKVCKFIEEEPAYKVNDDGTTLYNVKYGPSTYMNLKINKNNINYDTVYTIYITNLKGGFTITRRFKFVKSNNDIELA